MRKALVVGVDHYERIPPLMGCVNDAHAVKAMLERNADGSVNFHVMLMTGTGPGEPAARKELRKAIEELFKGDSEIALLYFAGHGYVDPTGGTFVRATARAATTVSLSRRSRPWPTSRRQKTRSSFSTVATAA